MIMMIVEVNSMTNYEWEIDIFKELEIVTYLKYFRVDDKIRG